MNQTMEDSRNYDVVFISFGKEKEIGIEARQSGRKDSFLEQSMDIKVGKCTASDMKFSKEQIKTLKENRLNRKTAKAVAMRKEIAR